MNMTLSPRFSRVTTLAVAVLGLGGDFQASSAQSEPAMISGRVLTTGGAPIARARIEAIGEHGSPSRIVFVERDGTFRIAEMGEGRYWVRAEAEGFLPTYFGQQSPGQLPRSIILKQNDRRDGIDIVMIRLGVLVGRVMTWDGIAIEHATVMAAGANLQAADTDDAGQFRLPRLLPGSYAVSVIPPPASHYTQNPQDSFAVTQLPESVSISSGELDIGDVVSRPGRLHSVSGRAITRPGSPASEAHVSLNLEHAGSGTTLNLQRHVAVASSAGDFPFPAVPEGEYVLRAVRGDEHGATVLTVNSALDGVTLRVHPGTTVIGNMHIEPSTACEQPAILATAVGPVGPSGEHAVTASLGPDGDFEFTHLFGSQRFEVRCGYDGRAEVRRMTLNSRGVSNPIEDIAAFGPHVTIQITAQPVRTVVKGTAVDLSGQPVEGLAVVARDDLDTWNGMPFTAARVIVKGEFSIQHLLPGRYFAFFEPPRRVAEVISPDYLRLARERARVVEVPSVGEVAVKIVAR